MYLVPRSDTMYELEHNKWFLLWQFVKYLFTGRGLFLGPAPETFLFAVSKFMNDKYETVAAKDRTAVFGRLQGSIMLGTAFGFLLGGVLGDLFGIRRPFGE